MAIWRKIYPLFFNIQSELKIINEEPEKATDDLIKRDPVFFQKTMFRAFLHLSKKECEEMSIDEYMNYTIMLKKVLETIHAPFMEHNNSV